MTISVNQQVDFLWKKIGYGVSKTDLPASKDATNESISSLPFLPGSEIWVNSHLIPPVIPATDTTTVAVYSDSASRPTVACVKDITAADDRTWLTNLRDWIPFQFGATYLVKVYLANIGETNPQLYGTQLFPAGANNNDEWLFDYSSGALHFIGDNLPAVDFTGKQIFIAGARYVGLKGLQSIATGVFDTITVSNILGTTSSINFGGAILANVGYPVNLTDAASVQYVNNAVTTLTGNTISDTNSSVSVSSTPIKKVAITVNGTPTLTAFETNVVVSGVTITGNQLSTASNILSVNSTAAFQVPTGTTVERPGTPAIGYVRFNTTSMTLEYYNGTDWISSQAQIESQTLVGNAIDDTFTLTQPAIAQNLLVTINGVVQTADVAYTVVGNSITFASPPAVNDIIIVRFMTMSVSPLATGGDSTVIDSTPILVNFLPQIIDTFSIGVYASAKYTLSITANDGNRQLADLYVAHNGVTSEVMVTAMPMTNNGATAITYGAYVSAGICGITAASSTPNTQIKVKKTYFTL